MSEFYFISLDIFINLEDNKKKETIINELEAWLYFIASDKPEHIEKVLASVPRFEEMKQELEEKNQTLDQARKELTEKDKELNEVKQELERLREELAK